MKESGAKGAALSHVWGFETQNCYIFVYKKHKTKQNKTKQNKTKQNKTNSFTYTKQITKYYTQTKQP